MALSSQDASAALRDIEDAEARSSMLRDYRNASPHLISWGVLWMVGYGLNDVFPMHGGAIWSVVVPVGLIADLAAMRGRSGESAWRQFAAIAAVSAFVIALVLVMAPVSGRQIATVIPLFVALLYVLRGIWVGPRYVVAGLVIAALTLAGFWFIGRYFSLYMAVVGGGALILGGLWLRRV
jgi:hypothetical protein